MVHYMRCMHYTYMYSRYRIEINLLEKDKTRFNYVLAFLVIFIIQLPIMGNL